MAEHESSLSQASIGGTTYWTASERFDRDFLLVDCKRDSDSTIRSHKIN